VLSLARVNRDSGPGRARAPGQGGRQHGGTVRHGVPDGYHTITPYMQGNPAHELLWFMEAAFGGEVVERQEREVGAVAHAEVVIGDSRVMVADPWPRDPVHRSTLHLYVPDADAAYARAMAAGARALAEPQDMPYGDRHGGVEDPSGNHWWIATRLAAGGEEDDR
jgi:PhnB protein